LKLKPEGKSDAGDLLLTIGSGNALDKIFGYFRLSL